MLQASSCSHALGSGAHPPGIEHNRRLITHQYCPTDIGRLRLAGTAARAHIAMATCATRLDALRMARKLHEVLRGANSR